MIFIYNCYGGTHTSSLASEIHLKRLPADRVPSGADIQKAKYFNELTYKDMGRLIFRGADDEGNKVYTLGRGTSKVLIPCIEGLLKLLASDCGLKEKFILSNMSPTVPPIMTIGGFLSRGLGIHFIGVPLLVAGARKAYTRIVKLVENTKQAARSFDGNVLVLYNDNKKRPDTKPG